MRQSSQKDGLWERPSPVIALNKAVAEAFAFGFDRGLAQIEELGHTGALDRYLYFQAARADLLRRLGRIPEACAAYIRALELSDNAAERRFLQRRLEEVRSM